MHVHVETCKIDIRLWIGSARLMHGATNKREKADGQRLMLLVDAICTRYGECYVHVLHTCGRSKSTWRDKPAYLLPDIWQSRCMSTRWQGGHGKARVGLVLLLAPWYRSSQPLVLFSLTLYPLTSLTSYHVRECASWYGRPLLFISEAPLPNCGLNGAGICIFVIRGLYLKE